MLEIAEKNENHDHNLKQRAASNWLHTEKKHNTHAQRSIENELNYIVPNFDVYFLELNLNHRNINIYIEVT